ncbi:MAG: hypothetical protein N3E40_02510, partial [Dehalococcoidia bacterium]|nr:hypothetical protein [Dehalococcoidia bacterium]
MKVQNQRRLVAIFMAVIIAAVLTVIGCPSPAPAPAPAPAPKAASPTPVATPTPSPTPTPTPAKYEWPRTFFIAAVGTPGTAKHVSWGSVLESSTGMAVRVVTEATNMAVLMNLKAKKMQYGSIDHTEMANNLEANEDHAVRDGGPWPVRVVWAHDLGFTGFMLRGDSPITYPWDIKPGVRIAVWNMTPTVLAPGRGLLAWAKVSEKDAVWVDAGTVAGAIRAVIDGRADLVQAPPTSPRVQEAAANPKGIKYLNLDASKDPDGAIRFQSVPETANHLWTFAPILTGVPEAIGVWGAVGNMIQITHADTDVDLIYNLTKWLDRNYDLYKDCLLYTSDAADER